MLFTPKKILVIIWAVLFSAALYVVFDGIAVLKESPFAMQRTYFSPSFVTTGDNKVVIIDNSKKRVTVLDGNYEITSTVEGGVRTGTGFYYAEFAVAGGDGIYIADACFLEAGTYISKERIIRYLPDGRFDKVLYELEYSGGEMPRQNGNIKWFDIIEGKPYFIEADGSVLHLRRIDGDAVNLIRSIDTADYGDIQCVYYNAASDEILFSVKQGLLYNETAGSHEPLVDWSAGMGQLMIWEFAANSSGDFYGTDIGSNRIVKINGSEVLIDFEEVPECESLVYRIYFGNDDVLSFTDNVSIMLADSDGNIILCTDSSPFSAGVIVRRIITWICAVFAALTLLAVIAVLVVWLLRNNRSVAFRTAVLLGFVIVVSSFFVTIGILSNTTERLSEKNIGSLRETATTISRNSSRTIGDSLEKIRAVGDYGGADYNTVRDYLDVFADSAYESGSNLYYIVFKHREGNLYGIMDYENTIMPFYPYMSYADTDYEAVCLYNEIAVVDASADSYGYWAYAVAPLFNSAGDQVGILEIGSDLYGEQLRTRELISGIVLSTAVLILTLLLFLSEATSFIQCLSSARAPDALETNAVLNFVRPLAFLAFSAENFSSAFTPQLSEKLFMSTGLAASSSIGAAIPMSAQLAAVAILALFGGILIDKLGVKKVLFSGLLVQLCGGILMAFAIPNESYYLLIAGKVLSGCGLGASTVSLNSIPSLASGEEKKNSLFSGLNVGLMAGIVIGTSIGAYIADTFGYMVTFFASSAISLIAAVITIAFLAIEVRKSEVVSTDKEAPEETSAFGFITNYAVSSFLFFVMFPFLIILYFKDYLFPLFASSAGYSDSYIGNILLFGGALSIYLSPALSRVSMKYFHAKGTVVLSSVFYILALVIFAVFKTQTAAIFTVFIISVAGGAGIISQGVYYSSLSIVERYGTGKAMGVFSLVDNLGQSTGPILLGALLIIGYSGASMIAAAAAFVLLALFMVINFTALPRILDKKRNGVKSHICVEKKGGTGVETGSNRN